ncbi:MAG: hypothetical protein KF764_20735 [Labilithrix sp.]|nr:hypothetical protein [Labilithrix sp.]MBX3224616.1 hypothetical protein [Labilithrix sp.]
MSPVATDSRVVRDSSDATDEPSAAPASGARRLLTPGLVANARRGLLPEVQSARASLTPDIVESVLAARKAARAEKAREAQVRLVVLGIWGLAVTLGGLFAFLALLY